MDAAIAKLMDAEAKLREEYFQQYEFDKKACDRVFRLIAELDLAPPSKRSACAERVELAKQECLIALEQTSEAAEKHLAAIGRRLKAQGKIP